MCQVKRAGWYGEIIKIFTALQGTLYLHSSPKGENEDLLLFMVPKMHQTTTLNGCHSDAGHQDHALTLSLLQEHFWWPNR